MNDLASDQRAGSPVEYPMWIAGESVRTNDRIEVRVPFDGSPAGIIYRAGPEQVDAAIKLHATPSPPCVHEPS